MSYRAYASEGVSAWARAASSARAAAATVRSTSSAVVCQLQTLTRMARVPRQVVLLKRATPVVRMAAVTSSVKRLWSGFGRVGRGMEEAHEALVHLRLGDDLGSRQSTDAHDQGVGAVAAAVDERGDAVTA